MASAAASSAQRASWNERRSPPTGAVREAAARSWPCSGASASRARPASPTGSRPSRGVHDRAQQPPARGDQRADPGVREEAIEVGLGLGRGAAVLGEHQHRGLGADPERAQAHRQLGLRQPAGERLGEHVAGQPPLGVAHRALAHQLERHHGHRLLQDQPLEVAQAAGVARGDQPRLRRAAPARGDGQHERAPGELGMVGHELARLGALPGGQAAAPHLLAPLSEAPPRAAGDGTASTRSSRPARRARSPRSRSRPRERARPRRARAPRARSARAACGSRCRAAAPRTARSRGARTPSR